MATVNVTLLILSLFVSGILTAVTYKKMSVENTGCAAKSCTFKIKFAASENVADVDVTIKYGAAGLQIGVMHVKNLGTGMEMVHSFNLLGIMPEDKTADLLSAAGDVVVKRGDVYFGIRNYNDFGKWCPSVNFDKIKLGFRLCVEFNYDEDSDMYLLKHSVTPNFYMLPGTVDNVRLIDVMPYEEKGGGLQPVPEDKLMD